MADSGKRIVITGSTGNLGEKAVAALAAHGWECIRIGLNERQEPGLIEANLEHYAYGWARHFAEADAVLHLAADPQAGSGWDSIVRRNIDLALNVFRAAEQARVRRLVFASSNWVLAGYRFGHERLTSALPPRPVNPYGASKLFIERHGLEVAARTGMSVLALRIGYCQPGDNRPGTHMAFGRWGQQMWLGNRDWRQAVIRSVSSPMTGAAVLNIVSLNEGMRWDLEEARQTIGYVPEERYRPRLTAASFMTDQMARLRERLLPTGASRPAWGELW